MKEIDFTPDWYVQMRQERTGAGLRASGMIVIGVLVSIWYFQSTAQTRAAVRDLRQLQNAQQHQRGVAQWMDELNAEMVLLRRNQTLLDDLGGGMAAADLVAELSRQMPTSLWLGQTMWRKTPRVLPKGKDNPSPSAQGAAGDLPAATTLELSGWALSGADVGAFVTRLNASPLFSAVNLKFERTEKLNDRDVLAFLIECQMPEFE
jgi:hypothetical protein